MIAIFWSLAQWIFVILEKLLPLIIAIVFLRLLSLSAASKQAVAEQPHGQRRHPSSAAAPAPPPPPPASHTPVYTRENLSHCSSPHLRRIANDLGVKDGIAATPKRELVELILSLQDSANAAHALRPTPPSSPTAPSTIFPASAPLSPPPPPAAHRQVYTKKDLSNMKMGRLLNVAKCEFGIQNAYAIPESDLIDKILKLAKLQTIAAPAPPPEPGPDDHGLQPTAPPFPTQHTAGGLGLWSQSGAPQSLPAVAAPKPLKCVVCHESMGSGTSKHMAAPRCGHAACEVCLNDMESRAAAENRRPRCALCKAVYSRSEVIRIYA